MSDEQSLVERNAEFAANFCDGDLGIKPRLSTLIVSCVDSRVDPSRFLGLESGDAFVLRNVGGRITDDVITQIKIVQTLGVKMMGVNLNVAVIHHTGCGAASFINPEIAESFTEAIQADSSVIESLAITSPAESIQNDIDRLRSATVLPDEMLVSGYVYDISNGRLKEIAAPSALRTSD